jgi:ferric-dicitrate binding protein FerR (iron transport regulator)
MRFQDAISVLNPNITVIRGDVAYDADGNEVAYDKAAVQAYVDAHAYIAKRQAEYPPVTDWLDGMVKGDQAQIDKYIADCVAVKAKYKKGVA